MLDDENTIHYPTNPNGEAKFFNNNSEILRASFTGMAQTYGTKTQGPIKGDSLNWLDSSGKSQPCPWQVPTGYKIIDSFDDPNLGGRFVIYQNTENNTVMLVPMGTNGADGPGWLANFKDTGISQWRDSPANVKENVYSKLNLYLNSETKLIIAGDSKGGAIAQVIVYDAIKDRNSGYFKEHGLANLQALKNEQIYLVTRVAPSIEEAVQRTDPGANLNDINLYAGINAIHITTKGEMVNRVGGTTMLAGYGYEYYMEQGLKTLKDFKGNIVDYYIYLHRLLESGMDWAKATHGDLSVLTLEPRSFLGTGTLPSWTEKVEFGYDNHSNGSTESWLRLFFKGACAIAAAPIAIADNITNPDSNTYPLADLTLAKTLASGDGGAVWLAATALCGAGQVAVSLFDFFSGNSKALQVNENLSQVKIATETGSTLLLNYSGDWDTGKILGTNLDKTSNATDVSYVIKSGDTLSKLAQTYNTTVDILMAYNPYIVDRDKIYSGKPLVIPGIIFGDSSGHITLPASGLTLSDISLVTGLNQNDIQAANLGIDFSANTGGLVLNLPTNTSNSFNFSESGELKLLENFSNILNNKGADTNLPLAPFMNSNDYSSSQDLTLGKDAQPVTSFEPYTESHKITIYSPEYNKVIKTVGEMSSSWNNYKNVWENHFAYTDVDGVFKHYAGPLSPEGLLLSIYGSVQNSVSLL